MNDIISQVTPLTRGIIWLAKDEPKPASQVYKALDYLLNGLLTASLQHQDGHQTSRLIMTENFGFPLHIFIIWEFQHKEFESFSQLVTKGMGTENNILVIDEAGQFPKIQKHAPKDLGPKLSLLR